MNALLLPRRATTLALAATLALGLTACGTDEPEPTGSTPHAGATTTPAPTDEAPEDAATPSTPSTGDDAGNTSAAPRAVAVYFVGSTPAGPRLFREFRNVTGDALTEAARLVDGGGALDPDYRTLWPGMALDSVATGDGTITVTLKADAFTQAPDGMETDEAELAIQQLVHTLQAVAGDRLPVRFERPSGPATLFGVDVSEPVTAADPLDVLAGVNLTTPAQGASTARGTLAVAGVANADEATVQWRIEADGEVVLNGSATAEGWMDKLYPFETSVDVSSLEPGQYVFVAANGETGEGEEGFGPTEDSKAFTVR
ncbi:Gmad2 immunoglobulin-like domain-containing protein [Nocardioides yefusunii]|uniref:Gmad2 immunoglobulin-like domain-containing protein n=1 Tax=Nocardioides yefusunii TaxID=2500546 RepID=A0ABW1R0T2_9ACTN|nr:Gmad2 immunoglobulin-like domain-containing protein [Nocardioides yefusunii]